VNGQNAYWDTGTVIKVWIGPGFTPSETTDLKNAVQSWSQTSGLAYSNVTFQVVTGNDPVQSNGLPPSDTIRIYNDPAGSPTSVATTTNTYYQDPNGNNTNRIAGANVAFNKGHQFSGANGPTLQYDPSLSNADTFFTTVGLHETGHAVGLDDAPAPIDDTGRPNPCLQQAGASIMNGSCGSNDLGDGSSPGGRLPTSITQCDKDLQSSSESMGNPPPPSGGNQGCLYDNSGGVYIIDGSDGSLCSPIIIDVDGSEYFLTDASGGVNFDLNGNGFKERLSWTSAGSTNVFLVLDRNSNGLIDNGGELFGNYTRLANGTLAPNGWVALAEFDKSENGGNGDGAIDKQDAIFPYLRLWQDKNHNGISEPEEAHTLPSLGVEVIHLDFRWDGRRDRYGNQFRYRAVIEGHDPITGQAFRRFAYDIFLLTQSSAVTKNSKPRLLAPHSKLHAVQ
jgi:hypothetical protein